ncbi:MAG: hypothetical protein WD532_00880 [Acidimicrobiia bacterium]
MNLIDFLLPTTDAGVAIQVVAILSISAIGLYLTRHHADARLLVTGATLLAVAFMALRTLH